jgi:hypothetical protein
MRSNRNLSFCGTKASSSALRHLETEVELHFRFLTRRKAVALRSATSQLIAEKYKVLLQIVQ